MREIGKIYQTVKILDSSFRFFPASHSLPPFFQALPILCHLHLEFCHSLSSFFRQNAKNETTSWTGGLHIL